MGLPVLPRLTATGSGAATGLALGWGAASALAAARAARRRPFSTRRASLLGSLAACCRGKGDARGDGELSEGEVELLAELDTETGEAGGGAARAKPASGSRPRASPLPAPAERP